LASDLKPSDAPGADSLLGPEAAGWAEPRQPPFLSSWRLALVNGTSVMTGLAALATHEAEKILRNTGGTFNVLFFSITLLIGILMLFAGVKMRRLESYGLCMTASILAMIPCLSCCFLAGLPVGIWALVVLSKPEVKDFFH